MAVAPTVPQFLSGVLTTTELNQLRDAINFLYAPPRMKVRQTVAQSLPTATWTSILFDVEDYDTDPSGAGGHSTSVNTSRFTAVYAGWYLVSGGVTFGSNSSGFRATRWAVNGSAVNASQSTNVTIPAGNPHSVAARVDSVFLDVGDYVEMQGWQSSGGALLCGVIVDSQSGMVTRYQSAN